MPEKSELQSHAERFLAGLAAGGASQKTVEARHLGLNRFVAYARRNGVTCAQDITEDLLETYRSGMLRSGLSVAAVEQYFRAPHLLLEALAEEGVIFENPCRGLAPLQRAKALPKVPGEKEVAVLLSQPDCSTAAGLRDRAILEFLYSTGARISEAMNVRTGDVDTEAAAARLFGKGSRERLVPLGRSCRRWMGRYLEQARPVLLKGGSAEALWIGVRAAPLGIQAVEVRMKQYSRKAGIDPVITPHALRRAMATHMLHRGADPITIQAILGHASLKHLSQYLRLTVSDLRNMHRRTRLGE